MRAPSFATTRSARAPGPNLQAGVENINAANRRGRRRRSPDPHRQRRSRRTGLEDVEVRSATLNVFAALLDALNVSRRTGPSLRASRLAAGLYGRSAEATDRRGGVRQRVARAHRRAAGRRSARRAARHAGVGRHQPVGSRTMEEITDRFLEQAADAFSARLPRETQRPDLSFLGMKVPACRKPSTLCAARAGRVDVDRHADRTRSSVAWPVERRLRPRGDVCRAVRPQHGILHRLRLRVLARADARSPLQAVAATTISDRAWRAARSPRSAGNLRRTLLAARRAQGPHDRSHPRHPIERPSAGADTASTSQTRPCVNQSRGAATIAAPHRLDGITVLAAFRGRNHR